MKTTIGILFATALALSASAGSAQTTSSVAASTEAEDVIAHGGGCRKDSPPGMCCHAGSKPYHCH